MKSTKFVKKISREFDSRFCSPNNGAAMRNALLTLIYYWDLGGYDILHESRLQKLCRAALAAPARNCDKYANAIQAKAAFESFIRESCKFGFFNPYTELLEWFFSTGGHNAEHNL